MKVFVLVCGVRDGMYIWCMDGFDDGVGCALCGDMVGQVIDDESDQHIPQWLVHHIDKSAVLVSCQC